MFVLVAIACSLCELQVCLRHRLPEDHNCTKLSTNSKRTAITIPHKPLQMKDPKSLKSLKSRKMAAKVALMKLKLHSKGDNSLPDSERLYFSVHALTLKSTPVPLFVSRKWTVGKAIDFMSNKLNLHNDNNKVSKLKLRLCSAATGEIIAANLILQSAIEDELLFNGSTIVIALINEGEQYVNVNY